MNNERIINGVEFLLSDKKCFIKCKRRSLITFVDIMHVILNNGNFDTGKFLFKKKTDLIRYYSAKINEEYFFEFRDYGKNESFDNLSSLLFYIVEGNFEDEYYRDLMLKTNKNSVFGDLK
jgi:hypothetical protein